MGDRVKYPRTFHLPFSLGVTSDDKVLKDCNAFTGLPVIVTEKLDGENTTMYSDFIHARSLDSKNHPSRNWVKGLWASIRYQIPEGFRICGENLYAKHSIFYDKLETYFYVFSVWCKDTCLSWVDTLDFCAGLGLKIVPVLYAGTFDIDRVKACFTGVSALGVEQEGYVLRIADNFLYQDFSACVAKFVRSNHIQTDKHWSQQLVIPNKLGGVSCV